MSNRRASQTPTGPMMHHNQGLHHPPAVPLSQAQLAEKQQQQQAAIERAKLRARKPTDKTMPDGVEDCIMSDGVQRYKDLRDFERRLDATITRKRLDIVDSVSRNAKRYKTMRIWITNTVEDQVWQGNGINADTFDFSTNAESSFRVKIQGELLDDDDDEYEKDNEAEDDKMDTDAPADKAKTPAAKAPPKPRFSHFFKHMTVEFDRSKMRNGAEQSVEWNKPDRIANSANPPAAADFDELTFKRNGDENMNITINLFRDENPERFELSPALADVVDMEVATRSEVQMGMWEYIKLMGLQEDEEKRNFRCDELLKKVVGRDAGSIPALLEYIGPHLRPLPPVKLFYTVRVDEEFHKDPKPTVYDVRVAVGDSLQARLMQFFQDPQYVNMLNQVKGLDDQLAIMIQAIAESKAKHSFLESLSKDPANFVRNWLSSQKRDLEVIMGEANRGGGEDATGDEWRKGGKNSVWATQNARESVQFMFTRR
ncbi:SWI/SNF and RSC complexes subunit ssr3 [Cytospora mali]|uniref:SWI/SNF and RSC complexes subunit ssr3 n=1 Tax=Cytospora mali TaxID=578113 RepID=A0A194V2F4_CYTMA|nr:SWI/SNF and RSC complexes subunit ssr3 [Valsa mali var. pyri (nom. inval.)]